MFQKRFVHISNNGSKFTMQKEIDSSELQKIRREDI